MYQAKVLGLIPDWQFQPQPPPIATGKYDDVQWYLPGSAQSQGITGAMGLGQYYSEEMQEFIDQDVRAARWIAFATIAFMIHSMLRLPLAVVDGVHGYKRNRDDGASAAAWGALGFVFPLTTTTVALFQGYGKPKGS